MIGWFISVYTLESSEKNQTPPTFASKTSKHALMRWSTGLYGMDWIRKLTKDAPENCVDLGGNGYPFRFAAKAAVLKPILLEESTIHGPLWKDVDSLDVREGQRNVNAIRQVPDTDWLMLEIFDES